MTDAPLHGHFTRRVGRGGLLPSAACVLLLLCCAPSVRARRQTEPPHLRRQGTATQLVVDGKPFLVRGGELGNSSSSSLEYMRPVWPKLAALKLNTVVIPVYWELVEPAEGKFDFSLVDGLIRDARQHGLKLVPLWFATWKNSMSTYVPAWVKRDQKRFPRSQDGAGRGIEILSTFSLENTEADARAFAALMRHLREVDGREHTVIMVQVENEIGMIPEARDHSATADSLYARPVPPELLTYLQRHADSLVPELRAKWGTRGNRTQG
ncbi:MAG TPA: beta-galactosidase, partial [Pyrinomonadaceae bacterium]